MSCDFLRPGAASCAFIRPRAASCAFFRLRFWAVLLFIRTPRVVLLFVRSPRIVLVFVTVWVILFFVRGVDIWTQTAFLKKYKKYYGIIFDLYLISFKKNSFLPAAHKLRLEKKNTKNNTCVTKNMVCTKG